MATAKRLTHTEPTDVRRAPDRPRRPNRNLFQTGDRLPRQEFERRYALMAKLRQRAG